MTTSEFLELKINYIGIGIKSILYFLILLLLFFIEIFVFWGIYGEGATASRIAELWYVELFLNYLPISLIGGFLIYRITKKYYRQEYVKFKTNLITLLILIFLFFIRNQLDLLIF